ncbi:MAG: ATP-dependent DNA helicase [Actinomycetaceae bacterium]|nr:ATP-dependent DNA helicase [Actinomycetaceae bacterium]
MKLTVRQFVQALNEQLKPGEKKILLSNDQAEVVAAPSVPTLVVAGAGSGKTEVMSLRALYLLYRDDLEPDSILGLTFTRKATANFRERLSRQLELMRRAGLLSDEELAGLEPTVSTYNAFAKNMVTEYGLQIGVSPSVAQMSEARAWQVVDNLLERYTGELPNASVKTMREAILALSQSLTEHQIDPMDAAKQFERTAQAIENAAPSLGKNGRKRTKVSSSIKSFGQRMHDKALLMPLVQQYWDYKREWDLIDFTDQLALARKIIEASPEVVEEIRSQYKAILLDEFQDTSVGQLELFSGLFHDTAATAVGDPNQAIYGWRGASAASLSMFQPSFDRERRGEVLQLRDAWRNWPNILEAANRVIQPDEVEVKTRQEAFRGVNLAVPISMDGLRANPNHPGKGLITFLYPATQDEEFEFVARQIKQWQVSVKPGEKLPSIAVLSRTRKALPLLYKHLQDFNVNARIIGVGGLLTEPAVTDVLATMRALVEPDNGAAVMRLVSNLDLSAKDISILWDWARQLGRKRVSDAAASDPSEAGNGDGGNTDLRTEFLLDAVLYPPKVGWKKSGTVGFSEEARARVLLLGKRLERVREHMDLGVAALIAKIVRILDLDLDIAADPFDNQGEVAIDAFIEFAANYEAETPFASVRNFLDWVDITLDAEERLEAPVSEPDEDVVQLLTIHQSKGLEWDKVVVVGLTESNFPGVGRASSKVGEKYGSLDSPYPEIQPIGGWMSELKELPYDMRLDREHLGATVLPVLGDLQDLEVVEIEQRYNEYRLQLALHEHEEARRLAYVAWTRASNELVLAGSWYPGRTPRFPSRYLLQMLKARIGDEEESLVRRKYNNEYFGLKLKDLRRLVVEYLADAEPPAPADEGAGSFPRQPSRSRELMTQAGGVVEAQIEATRQKLDAGGSIDELLEGALNQLVEGKSVQETAELHRLVRAVRDAIYREKQEAYSETVIEVDRLNATQAQRFLEDPNAFALSLRRPVPPEPSVGAQIGTLFHRWAEQWLGKAAQFDQNTEPVTNVAILDTAEEPEQGADGSLSFELRQIEHLIARAKQILGENPAGVQAVEEDFSYSRDGITIRGRYDAVLKIDGKWVVLDWKSGAPPRAGAKNRYIKNYATQLEIYRRALAEREGLEPEDVDAVLVFLGGKDCPLEERKVRLEDLQAILKDYDFERDWKSATATLSFED